LPSCSAPKEGIPQEGILKLGIPEEGIPEEGIPKEGITKEGILKLGIPKEGIPKELNTFAAGSDWHISCRKCQKTPTDHGAKQTHTEHGCLDSPQLAVVRLVSPLFLSAAS